MPTLKESALNYLSQGFSVIPFYPKKNGGCCLSAYTQFRDRLPTEAFVRAWWDKWPDAMIAIVGGKLSDICMVDCDSQESLDIVNSLLPDNYECPIDITPRAGTGHHFYFRNETTLKSKDAIIPKLDFKGEGGVLFVSPSIRNDGQYKPLNGCALNRENLQPIPVGLLEFLKQHIVKKKNTDTNENNEELKKLWNGTNEGGRNHSLARLVGSWIKLELSKEECLFNANLWNQKNNPPLSESEIVSVINSVFSTDLRNNGNLSEEIRAWVSSSVGIFLISDVAKCHQLSARTDLRNLSNILGRLVEEKVIVRHGDKNGCFRKVDNSLERIDWESASDDHLDIRLPLNVTDYCNINPSNILIVAGCKDAGKSAFCLNTAILNLHKYKINYYSNEMGDVEIKRRLKKAQIHLNVTTELLRKINFYKRLDNFADVIEDTDNTIHIIDYVDVTKDVFLIGDTIKTIFGRLKKSVCLIALQKDYGKDLARGGASSLDKARIYVTLERGKAKILSGKDWVNEHINPAGLELSYKLIQGCKFIIDSEWK